MPLRFLAFSMLFAILCSAPPAVADWTRFRGPNGTGVVDDPSIPAVPTKDDLAWNVELPGVGHSSPVVWGDKVFLTSALEEPAQRIVLCLSAVDGAKLWERRYDYLLHKKHKLNSFASSTPAVDKDHVYISWSMPENLTLFALTHDGRDAWSRDFGKFVGPHGSGNSPVVFGDMVVIVNEQDDGEKSKADGDGETGVSHLHALACKDGSTVWQVPRISAAVTYSAPMMRDLPAGKQELIFNSQGHGISGIDPATGKTNWELPVLTKRSVSSPIVAGGLVFATCGSGGGGNYIVAVKPGPEPKEVYKITAGANYVPSLVAKGDLVFAISDKGIGSCFDAATGNVHWQERLGGNFFGSPIILNDRLYVIATDGKLIVLAASKEFQKLGELELGEPSHATPAVADGRLFLRTESHLYCVTGKK